MEQFRHLVRKYEEQSGESVTDNVRQAVFQAGIKDAAIRDHPALYAGRLNSFDKMAAEVSTVAGTPQRERCCDNGCLCDQGQWRKRQRWEKAKKVKVKRARGRRRPKKTGTSLIPSRISTSSRSVSTVTKLGTSELTAERRNVTMRNAETCRHRTV